jgi:beta-glucosidase
MTPRRFPDGFLWGTATAAHQVEGGNTNNQWWAWEQQPGRIWHDDRSGDACGWWQGAEADFDRMAALGLNAHRLSVEWSRIEPADGVWDVCAIKRYREMLEGLKRRGITPMVTLHHFTDPLWLAERGGWLSPETPARFARFAAHVVSELGDLCQLWCTINEPIVYATFGYLLGVWPPGHSLPSALTVGAALLRGHAAAATVIHNADPRHRVGIVHRIQLFDPASPGNRDVSVTAFYDYLFNGAVLRALRTGRIPPPLDRGIREVPGLRGSCDFIGVNYYTRELIAFDPRSIDPPLARRLPAPGPWSDIGRDGKPFGSLYPQGMERALRRVARLGLPIYVTETGIPDADDDQRPAFLLSHLGAIHSAIEAGADVRGVFLWSMVDNFEWAEGWGLQFGLYGCDQHTGERTLRRSAALYAAFARANALPGL